MLSLAMFLSGFFFLFNQYGGSERKVNVLDMQIYNLNFYKMLSPDLLDMLVG